MDSRYPFHLQRLAHAGTELHVVKLLAAKRTVVKGSNGLITELKVDSFNRKLTTAMQRETDTQIRVIILVRRLTDRP